MMPGSWGEMQGIAVAMLLLLSWAAVLVALVCCRRGIDRGPWHTMVWSTVVAMLTAGQWLVGFETTIGGMLSELLGERYYWFWWALPGLSALTMVAFCVGFMIHIARCMGMPARRRF